MSERGEQKEEIAARRQELVTESGVVGLVVYILLAAPARHLGKRMGERRIDCWMKPATPADE
nr:hypothetical protein [Candidatus Njordarchaeota archaeon]